MFSYPKQSEFNRVVPKTKIYAHTRVSKRVKELFVSQVGELVWRYKLSPETINLPARHGIREIQVFDIHLKTPEIDDAVLVAIDKAIPFPLAMQLFHEAHMIASVVPYKRPSEADSSKWVTEKLFKVEGTRMKDEGKSGREAAKKELHNSTFTIHPLPVALDLAGLYEYIVRHHIPLPPRAGECLADHVARFLALEAKRRERQHLEARLEREKQFNRKVELNATLRDLSLKLAELSAS